MSDAPLHDWLAVAAHEAFARDWIDAWNAHDLDRVLAHYADDVEFVSPLALRVVPASGGLIRGKANLRAYWARALAAYPQLQFTLHAVLTGVDSATLVYDSVAGLLAAEVCVFDSSGKIVRCRVHYRPSEPASRSAPHRPA